MNNLNDFIEIFLLSYLSVKLENKEVKSRASSKCKKNVELKINRVKHSLITEQKINSNNNIKKEPHQVT